MTGEIDEAWVERAVERYRRIETLRAEFDRAACGLEVKVRSPDGLVQLVVGGDGMIRDVSVGSLHGRTGADVAQAVQAAICAAADAARWARQKLHAEVFGDYPPLGGS